ncbi:MAG: ribosomal-protein-alanine N-acetyltransferase [Alteromonadaceae bacterium]|nr:MAG: ribosomal-protein-alanine N-acetyltransferase [Alteromonadaceae bacterium]
MIQDNYCSDQSFCLPDGQLCYIKPFDEHSLPDILRIENKVDSHPWSQRNFSESIASTHICRGVTLNDQWVAYAVFSLAADEAELLILGVDPAFQRQGIASMFLSSMETELRVSADEMFLEVRSSNSRAIALYEALEFNCIGERKNYYPATPQVPLHESASKAQAKAAKLSSKREDALIYGKRISENLCL